MRRSKDGMMMRTKRSAFALLLTLAILSVMTALAVAAAQYVYAAKRKSDDVSAKVQANRLFADIKKTFKKIGKTSSIRAILYTAPIPLGKAKGQFSAIMRCSPAVDAVNINWLVFDGNQTYQAYADATEKILNRLLLRYDSENPEGFVERLKQFVAGGDDDSQRIIVKKYGTITYQQFAAFLEDYELDTGDHFIEKVPWQDIFIFYPLDHGKAPRKIAANYMKKETVSLLYNIDPALVEELWQPGLKKLSMFLQEAGEDVVQSPILSEKDPKSSTCSIEFDYRGASHAFSFYENETEVSGFVFEK